jgi:TM2 domain-containing membrane protein YozV
VQPAPRYRSKTIAAWLALVAGTLGLHRFYLHGWGDRWGWLHPLPALAGLVGVLRLRALGQDDQLAWLLIPLLGAAISVAMGTAIIFALTPDDRWDARHNPGHEVVATRWGPVFAAVLGLGVGGAVLMGSIAYGVQMFFEWQLHG